jgi:hypothetical protein
LLFHKSRAHREGDASQFTTQEVTHHNKALPQAVPPLFKESCETKEKLTHGVNCEVEFHLPKFRGAISVAVGKGVSTSFWLDTGLALLPSGMSGRQQKRLRLVR